MSDENLFDYEDDLNIFYYLPQKDKDSSTKQTKLEESFEFEKPKIFNVKSYDFLKKKREESVEKMKRKNPWTPEEDKKLKLVMTNYPNLSWQDVASHFQERTHVQCMHRWQKVLQPGLKKGKWSEEEDKILINWVKKNGPCKWSLLTSTLKGRSSKQIRDRWTNNLNPVRAKNFTWSEQLDRILLVKYLEFGSSWVHISKFIPNSTENMIKNRFYSLLRSIASKKNKRCGKQQHKIEEELNKKKKDFEEFLVFDFEEDFNNLNEEKTKKRNNYSLTYLINFLPDLLEEKGIDPNNYTQNNYNSNNYGNSVVLEDDKKRILNNFFNTLSEKISPVTHEKYQSHNFTNFYDHCKTCDEDLNKKNAQIKFKSTILLNFQLHLLHRIFERCKLQIIHKFFQYFKGPNCLNTQVTTHDGNPSQD